jgi:hypothetical protein
MKLSENWGTFILVFILTLILGYYLGLAISTTVDYKLQDIQLRLPKPKNNITIEIIKKPKKKYTFLNKKEGKKKYQQQNETNNYIVEETEINDVKVKSNNKEIEKFMNYPNKGLKEQKRKKKKLKHKRKHNRKHKQKLKQENFTSGKSSKNMLYNPVLDQRSKYYNYQDLDKNILKYAKNYKKIRLNEKKQTVKDLVAYNHEEIETNFSDFVTNLNHHKDTIKVKPRKFINIENSKLKENDINNWDLLKTRDKLSPDFKCQRKYMNCTNNHEIIN